MPKPYRVPTALEVETALDLLSQDGPVPLAEVVDELALLRRWVLAMLDQMIGFHTYTVAKTLFCAGLALGLKIGELRARAAVDPNLQKENIHKC